MADQEQGHESRGFKITLKEGLLIFAGTALALGSFKSDDPWVVVPMLSLAGVAFVWLCLGHKGWWLWRITAALLTSLVLIFIGWRDLRHAQKESIVATVAMPKPASAQDSPQNSPPQRAVPMRHEAKPPVQPPATAKLKPALGFSNVNGLTLKGLKIKTPEGVPGIEVQNSSGAQIKDNQVQVGGSNNSQNSQNNSGGYNVQQVTHGDNSPIIDSPITIGNVPKKISPKDMKAIVDLLLTASAKSKIVVETDQYSGATPLPDDFYKAFKDGGWDMKYETVIQIPTFYSSEKKLWQGAVLHVKGKPLPMGIIVSVNNTSPSYYVDKVLTILNIDMTIVQDESVEDGVITVEFQGGFPN